MKNKTAWIVVGIVLAFALLVGGLFVSSNNKAIFLEEQINAAQADINVAEKRRFDLVYNLVDAVQSYQDYEGETLENIVSARNSMEYGDVDGAQMAINAVAEAYVAIAPGVRGIRKCSMCNGTGEITTIPPSQTKGEHRAAKISEIIRDLQEIQEKYGDVGVYVNPWAEAVNRPVIAAKSSFVDEAGSIQAVIIA